MPAPLELLRLARTAADVAARYLRAAERPRPDAWTAKGRNDFVTDCDRRAEELISGVLLAGAPGARLMGEELSPEPAAAKGLVWIVDPVDGTTNFIHGFPVTAISIAAAVDGVLQAALVRHLESGETFTATRGGGAWLDERPIRVSRLDDPAHALIGTGFPFKHLERLPGYLDQLARVLRGSSGVRRAGSAALDLAWLAAGRLDGFWELMLAPWDIAAGLLLVREAGGVATDFGGREIGPEPTGVVAGNQAIHAWLLAELR